MRSECWQMTLEILRVAGTILVFTVVFHLLGLDLPFQYVAAIGAAAASFRSPYLRAAWSRR